MLCELCVCSIWSKLNNDEKLKCLKDKELITAIQLDIERLHLCQSKKLFERKLLSCFLTKLFLVNSSVLQYLEYFDKTWINRNNRWYLGFYNGPCTINATILQTIGYLVNVLVQNCGRPSKTFYIFNSI